MDLPHIGHIVGSDKRSSCLFVVGCGFTAVNEKPFRSGLLYLIERLTVITATPFDFAAAAMDG